MLKQRIVTALALLAILLPALFAQSPTPFRVLSLLLIAVAAWEWARLSGTPAWGSLLSGLICGACCAGYWLGGFLVHPNQLLWQIAGLLWAVIGSFVLYAGSGSWSKYPLAPRLFFGLFVLFVAWVAVVKAWMLGINFLLSVFALVWVADIGAYFAGRAFGGHVFKRKLAPTISPGKSWEGVIGGMLGVLLLAWVWTTWEKNSSIGAGSLYLLLAQHGMGVLLASLIFLSGMSVIGDLFESLVKRAAGAKDSSRLLPGHGGVLDRVDALLPTLPMAMLLWSFSQKV